MRGRFAPSPTGELHLGTARTALVGWLEARAAGGAFVLRIEDLDGPRTVPGAEARILADLRWLGLDWDEGPDVGGPHGPYRQSERLERYEAAVARLLTAGLAYPCYCSRAEVARASLAPHGPGDDGPRYPGTCRDLDAAARAARAARKTPALRLRVPPGEIAFTDAIAGPRRESVTDTVGDFVLRRADGVHAYQLAVVVDDAAMHVTHVTRGDDLLGSTARQLLLYRLLDLPPPAHFAHVPLVLGPDGARLAKRHGAISLAQLRAAGATAEEITGRLAASLGLVPPHTPVRPADLVQHFTLDRLPRTPTVLDQTSAPAR
jgi:glutamyl-tRNA synthetase